ncbi:MAG: hypothetical protein OXU45_04000 [Candidatus Melainabacteria bacterium]|nr:hypothetical protein [Candidatus Melainabacteria bacterium]
MNVNLLPEEIWQDVFSQLKFDFEPTAAKEQVLIGFRLDEAGEIKLYSLGQIHDSI